MLDRLYASPILGRLIVESSRPRRLSYRSLLIHRTLCLGFDHVPQIRRYSSKDKRWANASRTYNLTAESVDHRPSMRIVSIDSPSLARSPANPALHECAVIDATQFLISSSLPTSNFEKDQRIQSVKSEVSSVSPSKGGNNSV